MLTCALPTFDSDDLVSFRTPAKSWTLFQVCVIAALLLLYSLVFKLQTLTRKGLLALHLIVNSPRILFGILSARGLKKWPLAVRSMSGHLSNLFISLLYNSLLKIKVNHEKSVREHLTARLGSQKSL